MNRAARARLLRKRFHALFPLAQRPWTPKTKRRTRDPEVSEKPRRIDFSLVGSRHNETPVKWIKKPDDSPTPTVAPKRQRKGQLPLTTISQMLQPGSRHLAR